MVPFQDIQGQIGYHPFLRTYALLQKKDPLHIAKQGMIYMDSSLQKRIPLTSRIQMISYSDNDCAQKTVRMNRSQLEKETHLSLIDVRHVYFPRGTHFYYPLETRRWKTRREFIHYAQHPSPGIFFIGEAISQNQGWTEGALQSVETILPRFLAFFSFDKGK